MSLLKRLALSISLTVFATFSFSNTTHKGDPKYGEKGGNIPTPGCGLVVDTSRINCSFLKLAWSGEELGSLRNVDIKIKKADGTGPEYFNFYGNEFLVSLLPEAQTVFIRPSVVDSGDPCPWEVVGTFSRDGDCVSCISDFTMFMQSISCSSYFFYSDFPFTITNILDSVGGNSIPHTTSVSSSGVLL